MGQMKLSACIIAVVLLLATAVAVYLKPTGEVRVKSTPLAPAMSDIHGWRVTTTTPLQDSIVESLHLDDYLFQDYTSDSGDVGLYIGYYLTTGKVGAAHDPLVCLPGQGWEVVKRGGGEILVGSSHDLRKISYSTMIVERNGEKEMFLYWFQSYDKAVAGTFAQKIVSLLNRIQGQGQDNAFVRLSCSLKGRDEQQCVTIFSDFLKSFYPEFLKYIKEG